MHVSIPPKLYQMVGLFARSLRLAIGIAKLGGGALVPEEKAFRMGDEITAIKHFGLGVLCEKVYASLSSERYQGTADQTARRPYTKVLEI